MSLEPCNEVQGIRENKRENVQHIHALVIRIELAADFSAWSGSGALLDDYGRCMFCGGQAGQRVRPALMVAGAGFVMENCRASTAGTGTHGARCRPVLGDMAIMEAARIAARLKNSYRC